MNSRNKGKRGEIELSHVLQGYGYDVKRGHQTNGALGEAAPPIFTRIQTYEME